MLKKTGSRYVFTRGKSCALYVRRRIPIYLRLAYPDGQTEILRALKTSDPRLARSRAIFAIAEIEAEFERKKAELDLREASRNPTRVRTLSEEQLRSIGAYWSREVLSQDETRRHAGLEDEEFEEIGTELTAQHGELRRMLAQGRTQSVLPALRSFLHLCGIDFDTDDARHATRIFTETMVGTLAHQLKRQSGEVIDTQTVAPPVPHPLHVAFPQLAPKKLPSWEIAFAAWRDYVEARPRSTVINYQTPWTDLKLFAARHGIVSPEAVTPVLMNDFVSDMRTRRLAPRTINERLVKIRSIYKIAISRFVVTHDPAANTLGVKESGVRKRRKRRLPFDAQDLNVLFGSTIYTEHKRSIGQSGEASYWIPLLMFYTGARPEEIAGLALADLREHPTHGWYLNLVDRPSSEDGDLFDGDTRPSADSEELLTGADTEGDAFDDERGDIPESHRRTLKNAASIRRVPVAQELIDLGLLRYREWLQLQGHTVFFPTLVKDWHGKLSGSFGKFFGRYMRDVGVSDTRKVLYSFRHTTKDLLEQAGVPSKYLKRVRPETQLSPTRA